MSLPPSLPYAPRRKKPLSLWNPLDYLVLLYWVFYFPQAFRWYEETFVSLPRVANGWQAVRQDSIQRHLALQGILLTIILPFASGTFLHWLGIPIAWFGVVVGVVLGVVLGVALGVALGVVLGVVIGVAFGVVVGVVGGVVLGVARGVVLGVVGGVVGVVALGVVGVVAGVVAGVVVVGVAGGVVGGVARGVALGVAGGVARGVALGVVVGVVVGVALGVVVGVVGGVVGGVALGVVGVVAILRLDVVLLGLLPALVQPSQWLALVLQRPSGVPIPRLRQHLVQQLAHDWFQGLCQTEGLLRYSLQFIPIIAAIQQVLEQTLPALLLERIAAWCSMPLHDWNVVFFQAASLRAGLQHEFWKGFFLIPRRWRPQVAVTVRYDTPARAACAGFWHLHEDDPASAMTAFATVRHLPHGEELYANAWALAAAASYQTLTEIATWQPPLHPTGPSLRPQVHTACAQLSQVAQDVALVQQSRSLRQRSSALNRASGTLSGFAAQLRDCPTPERPLLERIAAQWLKVILASASATGTLEVREPVASPYIVGAPVPAERLAGRADIFAQIESMWAKPGQLDSLVIYGHRRTGKSSIVRNLHHFCPFAADTGPVVLNLQTVDWALGLSDLCYAIAFALWEAAPTSMDEPLPDAYQHHPLVSLRYLLAHLNQRQAPRRYILMLDEYELLDIHLPVAKAEDFVTALRGFTQQYPWLTIALVGLHTLEERAASFYQAIYTWRPLKVGLMDANAVADVLQIQDDSFPLEYSLDAVRRAYEVTGGQPFLVQLLGDSLVQRFNRQLRQQLDLPSSTFTAEDVDAVVTDPQFYQQGDAYFRGIWAQADEAPPGQHALLQGLAPYAVGLEQTALQQRSGLDPDTCSAALAALSRHDVIVCHAGICHYSVELMRRWVASGAVTTGV